MVGRLWKWKMNDIIIDIYKIHHISLIQKLRFIQAKEWPPIAWGLISARVIFCTHKALILLWFRVDFLTVLFEVSSVFTSSRIVRAFQDIGGTFDCLNVGWNFDQPSFSPEVQEVLTMVLCSTPGQLHFYSILCCYELYKLQNFGK